LPLEDASPPPGFPTCPCCCPCPCPCPCRCPRFCPLLFDSLFWQPLLRLTSALVLLLALLPPVLVQEQPVAQGLQKGAAAEAPHPLLQPKDTK